MATLTDTTRGASHRLPAQALIGRAGASHVRIDAPYVSTEHAALRWTGEGWELRDLASRNGTFVGAHRLEPGQRVRLTTGVAIAFGRPTETWILADDAPPLAGATSGAVVCWAEDDLLLLPDASAEVCVYGDGRGGWTAEAGDRAWPVLDGHEVIAGGRPWVLSLPTVLSPTRELAPDDPAGAVDLALTFHVSRDEEHIEVTASANGRAWRLAHRAHSYLLLTLARARLDADPALPASEQGWLYHDELARGLGIAIGLFNMGVFRVRQQLKEAGVPGADGVIERRRGSGQIRLGVDRIEVEAL